MNDTRTTPATTAPATTTPNPSALAAGWAYHHSASLGMDYAVRDTPRGVEVMTADKVRYAPSEISAMTAAGVELDPTTHMVKRVMEGTLVAVIPSLTRPPEMAEQAAAHDTAHDTAHDPPITPAPIPPEKDDPPGTIPIF